MRTCEQCREYGISGRESYAWRLEDGQRVTLCLSHSRMWFIHMPQGLRPLPYGKRTKDAVLATAIVGQVAGGMMELDMSRCSACGSFIDHCQGHGEIGDPYGYHILNQHDDDDHLSCIKYRGECVGVMTWPTSGGQ